ncbi:MAG: hypothetical protein HN757_17360, partial [Calditrichaeota bacterium]|nr:hypothetical protein [Calditrichota bacterium]
MSDRVRFMKFDTVDTLKADKENNSARYVKGFEWDKYLPSDYFRESSVPIDASKFNKIKLPDGGDNHDIYNSLFVYNLFNELTPEQAYDERVWTYYSHTIFHDYVVSRWIDGSSNKDRSIRSHMFVHGDRGLVRDNGIARLWWMGFIAHNIASQIPFSVEHVLNILLFKADVRSNIIERPSSAANMKISAAIIILLAESY